MALSTYLPAAVRLDVGLIFDPEIAAVTDQSVRHMHDLGSPLIELDY